jgi:hypothetical protein
MALLMLDSAPCSHGDTLSLDRREGEMEVFDRIKTNGQAIVSVRKTVF